MPNKHKYKITKKKINRKRKTYNKKNSKKKTYKGGCGCNNVKPWIGGTEPNTNFDLQNLQKGMPDLNNDPNNLMESGRNYIEGGRHKRTKRKILKGGDPILGQNPNMPILSFGTTSGAFDFYNITNMSNSVNPAPYVQPVLKMYGDHNFPLV